MTLQGGSGYGMSSEPGHSNRVFSVKFHPNDPEVRSVRNASPEWDHSSTFMYVALKDQDFSCLSLSRIFAAIESEK